MQARDLKLNMRGVQVQPIDYFGVRNRYIQRDYQHNVPEVEGEMKVILSDSCQRHLLFLCPISFLLTMMESMMHFKYLYVPI